MVFRGLPQASREFFSGGKAMREDEPLLFFCLVLIALARAGAVSPVAFATASGPLVRLSPGTLHLLPGADSLFQHAEETRALPWRSACPQASELGMFSEVRSRTRRRRARGPLPWMQSLRRGSC
jgi:hypothetical protein